MTRGVMMLAILNLKINHVLRVPSSARLSSSHPRQLILPEMK